MVNLARTAGATVIGASSCVQHAASGSRPFLPIRPVACCAGTMQEIEERISKDLWLSEADKLRRKKKDHKMLRNIRGGCTDLSPQYVSKIGNEAVELGNLENGRIHILTNHRQDIICHVPTHTVRRNSPSMNESAIDNKHQQSLIPESRFTFQNPQLERPILNLQVPQYDRVVNDVSGGTVHSEKCFINGQDIKTSTTGPPAKDLQKVAVVLQEKTTDVYDTIIFADNVSTVKKVDRILRSILLKGDENEDFEGGEEDNTGHKNPSDVNVNIEALGSDDVGGEPDGEGEYEGEEPDDRDCNDDKEEV